MKDRDIFNLMFYVITETDPRVRQAWYSFKVVVWSFVGLVTFITLAWLFS